MSEGVSAGSQVTRNAGTESRAGESDAARRKTERDSKQILDSTLRMVTCLRLVARGRHIPSTIASVSKSQLVSH